MDSSIRIKRKLGKTLDSSKDIGLDLPYYHPMNP